MKKSGFTIIEFLIVLLIAAIFIMVAVPSYYALIQNNSVVTSVNDLSAGFYAARMEAIKRGVSVSVCPAANTSLNSCGGSGNWARGWIVFIDEDNNNQINAQTDLVKVQEALPQGVTVTTSQSIVSFDGSGFLRSPVLTMTIRATGCTGRNARNLSISSSGRLSIAYSSC